MEQLLRTLLVFQTISAVLTIFSMVYFLATVKKSPLLFSFISCQVMALMCIFSYTLELLLADSASKRIPFIYMKEISMCLLGLSWILFCLYYTKNQKYLKITIPIISTIPALFISLMLTNSSLLYSEIAKGYTSRTSVWWFFCLTLVLFAIISIILVVRFSIRQNQYRIQVLLIVIAILCPLLTGIAVASPILPTGFDATPASFSISLIIFGIAAFKFRFLDIMPLAFTKIISCMKEAVIIIDNNNQILNFNNSFSCLFGKLIHVNQNDNITVFTKQLKEFTAKEKDMVNIFNSLENCNVDKSLGEIVLLSQDIKILNINIQVIPSKKGALLGKVISFNDVTNYRKLLDEIKDKNEELYEMNQTLTSLNEQLRDYASTVEELTISKERNRYARELHDTLGRTMTIEIKMLELCKANLEENPDKSKEVLTKAIDITKQGLNELRHYVSGIAASDLESFNLKSSLDQLVSGFKHAGLNIDLTLKGSVMYQNPSYSEVLYKVCQEALTNSLKHGKASKASIVIQLSACEIGLYIFDNGVGSKDIKEGNGLSFMRQRLVELGGFLIYGSDGENGFSINVKIPLEVKNG